MVIAHQVTMQIATIYVKCVMALAKHAHLLKVITVYLARAAHLHLTSLIIRALQVVQMECTRRVEFASIAVLLA
jgi:hypothetical protein